MEIEGESTTPVEKLFQNGEVMVEARGDVTVGVRRKKV